MKLKQITAQMNPISKVEIDLTELTPRELDRLAYFINEVAGTSNLFGELTDELLSAARQINAYNELTNK